MNGYFLCLFTFSLITISAHFIKNIDRYQFIMEDNISDFLIIFLRWQ